MSSNVGMGYCAAQKAKRAITKLQLALLFKEHFLQLQVRGKMEEVSVYPGVELMLMTPFQGQLGILKMSLWERNGFRGLIRPLILLCLNFCLCAYLSSDMTKVSYLPIHTCNLATNSLQLGDRK